MYSSRQSLQTFNSLRLAPEVHFYRKLARLTATEKLTHDAWAIWQAGVEAVTPERLFRDKVRLEGTRLQVDEVEIDLASIKKLIVVGAGKASAAMALALQQVVLSQLPNRLKGLPISGWINAPEDAFSQPQATDLEPIHLHAARPAGLNWPTDAAVFGTEQILNHVRQATSDDLVVCLLSGGGSALLVAPRSGVSLVDKQAIAREIAAAGGNIEQLNAVRRAVSEVKGGGLARACKAARLLTLVISDVLGDPLETIASGPTWLASVPDPQLAWETLKQLGLRHAPSLSNVVRCLEEQIGTTHSSTSEAAVVYNSSTDQRCQVEHVILGNNADAIDAAGVKAVELGYRYVMQGAQRAEGDVLEVAHSAVAAIEQLTHQDQIDCWISGGEPTVTLPADGAGKGGRNQQLALAVLHELQSLGWPSNDSSCRPLVFISGGSDGEDGPTDAAGAWIDTEIARRATALGLDTAGYLRRADAYSFFERVGGLLQTGPTGTNVCDLRVALAGKVE